MASEACSAVKCHGIYLARLARPPRERLATSRFVVGRPVRLATSRALIPRRFGKLEQLSISRPDPNIVQRVASLDSTFGFQDCREDARSLTARIASACQPESLEEADVAFASIQQLCTDALENYDDNPEGFVEAVRALLAVSLASSWFSELQRQWLEDMWLKRFPVFYSSSRPQCGHIVRSPFLSKPKFRGPSVPSYRDRESLGI
eukprot:jgi/Mesvir1/18860/Mv10514-RA.1